MLYGDFLHPENTENQDIWQYHELANSGIPRNKAFSTRDVT